MLGEAFERLKLFISGGLGGTLFSHGLIKHGLGLGGGENGRKGQVELLHEFTLFPSGVANAIFFHKAVEGREGTLYEVRDFLLALALQLQGLQANTVCKTYLSIRRKILGILLLNIRDKGVGQGCGGDVVGCAVVVWLWLVRLGYWLVRIEGWVVGVVAACGGRNGWDQLL